jgi:hypothetical protein
VTDNAAAEQPGRERFRVLPEQARPEDRVETVDVDTHPSLVGEEDERDRMLRLSPV